MKWNDISRVVIYVLPGRLQAAELFKFVGRPKSIKEFIKFKSRKSLGSGIIKVSV